MAEQDQLALTFEAERPRLRTIAGRMLGSLHEADDVVQETWMRLSRADLSDIANLPGWLTTVSSRICLDQLRARNARQHDSLDASVSPAAEIEAPDDPEAETALNDAVGSALMVLLERLSPTERVAFVLHDSFGLPFEEIAPIVGRTPATTRQLASRARRKVSGAEPIASTDPDDLVLIDAFLSASRNGDMVALLSVLAPEVVLVADAVAASFGVEPRVAGNERVANFFNGRAAAAFLARIDGGYGAIWMVHGEPRVVFEFSIEEGSIRRIDLVASPDRLATLNYELLLNRPA